MSVVQSRESRAKPGQKIWNLTIDQELHRAVKVRAAMDDVSMGQVMHDILCEKFDRPDLKDKWKGADAP